MNVAFFKMGCLVCRPNFYNVKTEKTFENQIQFKIEMS